MKKISVIARYNEDLSWVQYLDTDVIIYNKGETFEFDIPRLDVDNFGRESETFCRFILDWYDKLSEYDACVFLQGDPSGHSIDPIQIINTYNSDIVQPISTSLAFYDVKIKNVLNYTDNYALGKILEKDINFNFEMVDNHAAWLKESTETIYLKHILELFSLLRIVPPEKIAWAPGAQYIVPVKYILNKNIKWWEDLYLLHYIYAEDEKRSLPHIIERAWSVIWNHSI
jgi:hypothetical protein